MALPRPPQPDPRPGDPAPFRLDVDLGGCRVRLSGRLDRSTVHLLHDAISALLLTDADVWTVDATDVTSCDHMGVRGIGAAYRRALRHGRRMRLIGTPPSLHHQLSRLRLDHHVLERDDGSGDAPQPLSA